MNVVVDVVDRIGLDLAEGTAADLVRAVLHSEGAQGSVVVAFVDEQTMVGLNERYRGLKEPTDVLSFRYADDVDWPCRPASRPVSADHAQADEGTARNDGLAELGEVVVCPTVVCNYAQDEGTDPGGLLGWTLVHGALHLVGYDHEQDDGEMREREQTLLGQLDHLVRAITL